MRGVAGAKTSMILDPAEGVAENAGRRLEPGGDFPLLNENLSVIYKPSFD